jgi:hypothetical protein
MNPYSERQGEERAKKTDTSRLPGLAPKQLIGIPWRVAFALQADGWYLRSDIIWHKPNPMPESVRDRPTKAHEYLFLLSKSERYFYDADAVRESGVQGPHTRSRASNFKKAGSQGKFGKHLNGNPEIHCDGFRNRRSVWTVATRPFKGAHFATFPAPGSRPHEHRPHRRPALPRRRHPRTPRHPPGDQEGLPVARAGPLQGPRAARLVRRREREVPHLSSRPRTRCPG